MYTENPFRELALLIILTPVVFASCSDKVGNPTGPGSTSVTVTVPKTGSFFIYKSWDVDSNGVQIAGSAKFDTTTVLATGISFQSKNNVSQMAGKGGSFFVNYESNGDISGWEQGTSSAGSRSGWQVFPLGSKGQTTMTEFDTTFPGGSSDLHTVTITYAGESNVTLANYTFDTFSFQFDDNFTPSSEDNITETLWIAPQIGWLIKDHTDYQYFHHRNGQETELQSYTLK